VSFARTKIQAPRQRPGFLLARPALEARMVSAVATQRLVLLCAAAGYGKTSALARLVNQLPSDTALAWLSCDIGDSPLRLFQCLVSALDPYDLPWRVEPEALMVNAAAEGTPAAHRRLQAMVTELINALDACDVPHGVIVVDDMHRIEHPAVYAFLDLLLERFTPRWTLVIATRHEPPIALSRLRAQAEVAEFRLDDLRFARREAQAMLAAAGLDAGAADVLFERTQGWPVALRLGVHALNSAPLGASAARVPLMDRPMFAFLAAEVLDRLPADQRDFLLRTSILSELSAARCAALTGNAQSAQQLERIERDGLCVSTVVGQDLTLRLHDLLRDALVQRLQREHPESLPGLYARAAATEPDPSLRIDYLLRAGDDAGAVQMLYTSAPTLITSGAVSSVALLLTRCMASTAADAPQLQHVRGLLAWARWDFNDMHEAMACAARGHLAVGDNDLAQLALGYQSVAFNALGKSELISAQLLSQDRSHLRLETRLIVLLVGTWHAMDLGEMHKVGLLLDETMALLETTSDVSLWYRAHTIPRLNGLPGTASALHRYVDGVMRITADAPSPLRAMALVQRALGALWQGRIDAAEEAHAVAKADAKWLGDPPNVMGMLHLMDMLLPAVRGEREQALAGARRLVDEHLLQRGPWSLAGNVFYAARVAAAFDDLPALAGYVDQLEGLRDRVPPSMVRMLGPLQGMRAWLVGDHALAVQAWNDAIAVEDMTDRLGSTVEIRLRLAAAQSEGGDDQAAIETLRPTAERVASYAGLGGVLMARSALVTLAAAATQGRLGEVLGATVLAWHGVAQSCIRHGPARTLTHVDASAARVGSLSSREWAVLQRIAEGDSNKLIARAFELSPHTVKRHVANILDKLDLRSRGQAAAWYHDHANALPS
jgi:LuxR family transcriptional regulator, maltose regulon positive regulatory protein